MVVFFTGTPNTESASEQITTITLSLMNLGALCNSPLFCHTLLTCNVPEDHELLRFYYESVLVPAFERLPHTPVYLEGIGYCTAELSLLCADQKQMAFLEGGTNLAAKYFTTFGKISYDMLRNATDLDVSRKYYFLL